MSITLISFGLYTLSKRFGVIDYSFLGFRPKAVSRSGPSDPRHVTISSLGISLDVEKKAIEKGVWPVSDSHAVYLSGSGHFGQTGNAVIYAHNWPKLFGSLKKIRIGDKINVTLFDGSSYDYITKYTAVVTVDQTNILDETLDQRLTLYTCIGLLDRKRLIVVATR